MLSSQALTTLSSSSTNFIVSPQRCQIMSAIRPSITYIKRPTIVLPTLPDMTKNVVIDEFQRVKTIPLRDSSPKNISKGVRDVIAKLYAILEIVSDRIEMHENIKQQRENWNSLLLNSVNMITLTAATMVGISNVSDDVLGLKVSSMLLFTAATGVLLIMNKVQPSQLVEEQRNAVRLFKQLRVKIDRMVLSRESSRSSLKDVEDLMEKVLALDRAYPLPLLGAMLEKYPETFKPAVWWPLKKSSNDNEGFVRKDVGKNYCNGWSKELEDEMRDVVEVIEKKDIEDYVRLGNKALKLNKMLGVTGPMLTGVAAIGASFAGHGSSWGGVVAAVAGSLAGVVNTIQHGGQVGMIFEMYRNCAGFFSLMEQTVESTLDEEDFGRRENGELFELKMALKLGRSLSELRDLADKSSRNGGFVNEFASKLF